MTGLCLECVTVRLNAVHEVHFERSRRDLLRKNQFAGR